ncbi:FAD-binding protein [Roseobacter sp. HKCCD9010]|uniref:FAD-dependent oxidoreductase n=1 Tax=unclassified Roseobacter TaxID=196798 RepID=UPI0014931E4E|nr:MULTISPECIES: FAD-binding protein [unclassified Roseobacter]MBF9052159.1 FAD-binding protein [Rhodobacterales bacterium HKCCD4356]NNV14114.1 FAD-binding protein [Roseobacter sp. HKCCD7357]NNV18319.1 FAD-binding protein [Roseobacter sp. HKCCD8768]NNV27778.1 FAD-binding protein [Roseobacter sp. HKCCD8192]NNV32053.1 FAD-binding protein [Roseobacter sp. HKCCD9061]
MGRTADSNTENKTELAETEETQPGISRRGFFATGAAAGVGVAVAGGAQPAAAEAGEEWDYEVDVVVAGGGCAGLTAAIRAHDLGASVLVIDQNYDLGGRMLHSGSFLSLGGGDPVQMRDMAGEVDPDGYITVPPVEDPAELDDNVELLFTDVTDWSIVDTKAQSPYRYNERDMMRSWAENCPATRQFLMDNYVRFTRVNGTHGGGGVSRARAPYCFLMLGDVTDMRAGTITAEDAGVTHPERTSPLAPVQMQDASSFVGPGAVRNGVALARPLEFSAREKGVKFMLHRHFDELVREDQFSGRVLGVKASYSPRQDPETGEPLRSYWQRGNIDERRDRVRIRALKGVIIASGGHAGNPEFRGMFYPALREPAFPTSGYALLGPNGQDASGIIAGMKVGANLSGMQQNLSYPTTFHISTRLGTRDAYTTMMPGHPTFNFRGSAGINVGNAGFEEFIAVNQVGRRFFNEVRLPLRPSINRYPGGEAAGLPNAELDHVPNDWRNCRHEWIRQMYDYDHGLDAALAMNEGSEPPNYYSGPIWAIFDQDAVERTGWELRYPYVNEDNGYYFRADTIEELANKIRAGHPFQRVPLVHLPETVATWNSYVTDGADPEFEREVDAPMNPVAAPPFHALSIMVIWHDSYGGLRVNGRCQVVDLHGQVISGLYAGGEAVGGFNKHGLGKGHVHGYIAGTHVAEELG